MTQTKRVRLTGQEKQAQFFDRRQVGASLSRIKWSHGKAQRLMQWLQKPHGILLLVGPPGTGKTFCMAAVVDWLQPRLDDFMYYTERDLMERVYKAINTPGHDHVRAVEMMMDHRMVLINDMGSMGFRKDGKEFRQEVWFAVLDSLYEKEIPAIISTNLYERQLKDVFEPRFLSRLFNKDTLQIDLEGEKDWRQE